MQKVVLRPLRRPSALTEPSADCLHSRTTGGLWLRREDYGRCRVSPNPPSISGGRAGAQAAEVHRWLRRLRSNRLETPAATAGTHPSAGAAVISTSSIGGGRAGAQAAEAHRWLRRLRSNRLETPAAKAPEPSRPGASAAEISTSSISGGPVPAPAYEPSSGRGSRAAADEPAHPHPVKAERRRCAGRGRCARPGASRGLAAARVARRNASEKYCPRRAAPARGERTGPAPRPAPRAKTQTQPRPTRR